MRSPFKFLDAFTIQDKSEFFGRDQEVEAMYSLVFKTKMLLVYGLSGTGKTSIIQCGLAGKFDGPDWYPMFIRRNHNLNDSIQTAMRQALGAQVKESLVENTSLLLRRTLRPVYLIFDQFEELFILGSAEEQQKFMQSLRALLDEATNVKILLVMREEYIGQLYSFESDIPELFDYRFRIEPMGPAKVKSVITDSFDTFNIHLEEPQKESVQLIIDQINDPKTGITLPYLQVYLDMLYRDVYQQKFGAKESSERYPRLDISKTDIEELGTIGDVLAKFLERQSKEITTAVRQVNTSFPGQGISQILDVFATEEGTKRPVHYERQGEIIKLEPEFRQTLSTVSDKELTMIIEKLEQARILRYREDTLELAHDSLAAIIDRKRSDAQRELQNVRRRLLNAYDEYKKNSVYLNDKQLASIEDYLPKLGGISGELQAFLEGSRNDIIKRAAAERDRQRQDLEMKQQKQLARTRGILLTLATVLAAGAVFFGLASFNQKNKADKNLALLTIEQNNVKTKADSITNILTQVDQQLNIVDSIVDQKLPIDDLVKTSMTLKSLVRGTKAETTSAGQEDYASIVSIITTDLAAPEKTTVSKTTFEVGENVNLYLTLKAKQKEKNEMLQVKWFDPDGLIIGNPTYPELKPQNDIATVSVMKQFDIPGAYTVSIINALGDEIGKTGFTVEQKALTETESKILSEEKFFTLSTKPGTSAKISQKVTQFKAGATIYYWMRVYCPLPSDVVEVTFYKANGDVAQPAKKYPIYLNKDPGYMIWDGKTLSAGEYTIKVKNSQGNVIASQGLTVN